MKTIESKGEGKTDRISWNMVQCSASIANRSKRLKDGGERERAVNWCPLSNGTTNRVN